MSKPTNLRTNEPQMMWVMLPPPHLQAHAITAEPEPPQQEARSEVPQFGAQEGEAVDGYNQLRNANTGSNPSATSSESRMMNGRQNPEDQSRNHQKGKVQQTSPAGQRSQTKSKVMKFGAWEKYTVCFGNARKKKINGQMINPNDPQENPSMFSQNGGSSAQPPRAAEPNNDVLYYGWSLDFEPEEKPGQPFNMARFPLVNLDLMNERSSRPARPDEELAYGGGSRLEFKNRDRKIDGQLKNATSTTGLSASSAHPESVQKEPKIFQDPGMTLNNDPECQGHRVSLPEDSQLLPELAGHSSNKDAGHSNIAPRGFPASAVGSEAPVRKETEILESTSNHTPASDHLSIRQSNHKEKMGSCLPWLRQGMKLRLLKR